MMCVICGRKLGALSIKRAISDGVVCSYCLQRAGIGTLFDGQAFNTVSLKHYLPRYAMIVRSFSPTKRDRTHHFLAVDERNKLFKIGNDIFEYDSLLSYELVENGYVITRGGLSQAAGGQFFGGNGANNICSSLQLKVNLKNAHIITAYIKFIFVKVSKSDNVYDAARANAQSCIFLLENILTQVRSEQAAQAQVEQAQAAQTTTQQVMSFVENILNQVSSSQAAQANAEQDKKQQVASIVEEIEKLNQLLYSGLITQEEFDAKKKQLLGL